LELFVATISDLMLTAQPLPWRTLPHSSGISQWLEAQLPFEFCPWSLGLPQKGEAQKVTLNVSSCGVTAQKKPLISLAIAENKDVIVHMAVTLPAPGPSTDALFCLIDAWPGSVAWVQSNHL
jgi:hypothetical protein